MENTNIKVLASAARTAATVTSTFDNYDKRGLHLVINVSAASTTGGITPTIQGFDEASQTYYNLLVGALITTTGTTVLKIYPGTAAVANVSANDFLPAKWRVSMGVADANSFTYSITANLEA